MVGSLGGALPAPPTPPTAMIPPLTSPWRPDQSNLMKSQELPGPEHASEKYGGMQGGAATLLLEMSGLALPRSPRQAHHFLESPATPGAGGSIVCSANQSDRTPAPPSCRVLPADRVSRQGQLQSSMHVPTAGALHMNGSTGSFVGTSARLKGLTGGFMGVSTSTAPAGAASQPSAQSQTGPVLPVPTRGNSLPASALSQSKPSPLQLHSKSQQQHHQALASPQPEARSRRAESTERVRHPEARAASPATEPAARPGPGLSSLPLSGLYALRCEAGGHPPFGGFDAPLTPHLQPQQRLAQQRYASPIVVHRQASPLGTATTVQRQASPLMTVYPSQASPMARRCASPLLRQASPCPARQASPMRAFAAQHLQQHASPAAAAATFALGQWAAPAAAVQEAGGAAVAMSQRRHTLQPALAEAVAHPAVDGEDQTLKASSSASSSGLKACCPQGHVLVALGTSRDDGWDCDARGEPGGCFSGITGFNQTAGMKRFRCDLCVYDLCERCYLARARAMMLAQQLKAVDAGRASPPDAGGGELPEGAVEAPPAVPAPRSAVTPRRTRALSAFLGPASTGASSPPARPWGWQEAMAAKGAGHAATPPTAAASTTSRAPGMWSADLTYRLEGSSEDIASLVGKVPLLDAEVVCSVNQAVDGLNCGVLHCPEDFCIAYSASNRGWYLLHKRGKRDQALAQLGIHEERHQHQQHLHVGAVVTIDGCTCKVVEALGTGSFGTVWAAERTDGTPGEVAIKEILCRTQQERASASFEGRLLQRLHSQGSCPPSGTLPPSIHDAAMPGGGGSSSSCTARDRIPDLVGAETESVGPDAWRVRLAMTRVPGVPLDRFLEARSRRTVDTSLPTQQRQSFKEACNFARELVLQLAPAFEHVSAFAYHRDVNSHNILVEGDAEKPVFGLVDFGLAVDLAKWQGPTGPLSWHLVDIGGDCRYWPMSAWLQFECGWQELSKYPPLSAEYQAQLDFHALGITAFQVLAAMAPSVRGDSLPPELQALQASWEQYWEDATRFWQRLLEVFRNGGDQNALKVACIAEGVHNIVGANLASLRLALREAYSASSADGAAAESEGLLLHARPLFAALLELISAGGTVGFDEVVRPPNWEAVRMLVDASDTPQSKQGARPGKCSFQPTEELPSQRCSLPTARRSSSALVI
uniref:Protein kinase domain-containing protein n=1 Tax=Alexandrium monilatum TaxID=311494 RepID=A0A7S4UG06_9DINO